MDWNKSTKNTSEFETEFNELKSRYPLKQEVRKCFVKYILQLVFNELIEFKDVYLLLHARAMNLQFNPQKDFLVFAYTNTKTEHESDFYDIKPSFIKKFNHYKKFKYVLNRIHEPLSEPLLDNKILYDNPILPIIDKPEPIDLEKLVRPNRFPCKFEKIYNESDFSKYLLVHYHKIKNHDNLKHIENRPCFG